MILNIHRESQNTKNIVLNKADGAHPMLSEISRSEFNNCK